MTHFGISAVVRGNTAERRVIAKERRAEATGLREEGCGGGRGMKLSRREIAMVALCVVVAFIGALAEADAARRKSHSRGARRGCWRVRARCAALEQEIASLEKEVRSLSWSEEPSRLPTRILTELDLVAEKAGVTLATLRPGRPVAVASGSKLPFTGRCGRPFQKRSGF